MKVLILALSIVQAMPAVSEAQELVCSEVDGGMVCTMDESMKPKKPSRYDKCDEIEPGVKACYV